MNPKRAIVFVFIVLALLVPLACGGSDVPDVDDLTFTSFTSSDGSVNLEYPDTWVVSDDGEGSITIGSDQEIIDSDNLAGGGVVLVFSVPSFIFGDDPVQAVSDFVDESGVVTEEDAEVLQGATAVTVNGQTAAMATLEGEEGTTTVQIDVYAIVNGDWMAMVIASTPKSDADDYGPILDRIVESIAVTTPE